RMNSSVRNAECGVRNEATERGWPSRATSENPGRVGKFEASSTTVARCGWTSRAPFLVLAIALTGTVSAAELPRTSDHDYDAPVPGTYVLPAVKPAADGDVLDSRGHALRLREVTHGRVTVMSFIYTRCAAAR